MKKTVCLSAPPVKGEGLKIAEVLNLLKVLKCANEFKVLKRVFYTHLPEAVLSLYTTLHDQPIYNLAFS